MTMHSQTTLQIHLVFGGKCDLSKFFIGRPMFNFFPIQLSSWKLYSREIARVMGTLQQQRNALRNSSVVRRLVIEKKQHVACYLSGYFLKKFEELTPHSLVHQCNFFLIFNQANRFEQKIKFPRGFQRFLCDFFNFFLSKLFGALCK